LDRFFGRAKMRGLLRRAVTQLGLESLKAVMSGKITPEEAGRISTLLGVHHKTFETTELIERVKALEAQEN